MSATDFLEYAFVTCLTVIMILAVFAGGNWVFNPHNTTHYYLGRMDEAGSHCIIGNVEWMEDQKVFCSKDIDEVQRRVAELNVIATPYIKNDKPKEEVK